VFQSRWKMKQSIRFHCFYLSLVLTSFEERFFVFIEDCSRLSLMKGACVIEVTAKGQLWRTKQMPISYCGGNIKKLYCMIETDFFPICLVRFHNNRCFKGNVFFEISATILSGYIFLKMNWPSYGQL